MRRPVCILLTLSFLIAVLPFAALADTGDVELPQIPITGSAVKGDADGDKKVTSTDARMALQFAVELIDPQDVKDPDLLDVDRDGFVTSTDARMILQYSVGKLTRWP